MEEKLDRCWLDLPSVHKGKVITARAVDLLSSRLDLGFLLFYIESYVQESSNIEYAEELYKKRIAAVTNGTIKEIGQEKSGFEDFITSFRNLIDIFKNDAFDSNAKYIPLDADGLLLDGAHRVSCSLYFDIPLKYIQFSEIKLDWMIDAPWLHAKGFHRTEIDLCFYHTAKYLENLRAFVIWPFNGYKEYPKQFDEVILNAKRFANYSYVRNVSFSSLRLLTTQLYLNQTWIGSYSDSFEGGRDKAKLVMGKGNLIIYFAEQEDLECMKRDKLAIRDLVGNGFSTVHSTDNKKETERVLEYINDENMFSRMNAWKFPSLMKRLGTLDEILKAGNVLKEDIIVSGGAIMTIYGLRETNDLDIIVKRPIPKTIVELLKQNEIGIHNEYLGISKSYTEGLFEGRLRTFSLFNFTFISLDLLKKFKLNKSDELKHTKDVAMIDEFINAELTSIHRIKIKIYTFFRLKSQKVKHTVIILLFRSLRILGIRSVYRYLKRMI